ncbi:MAG: hypothetical protein V2B20_22330 [Pseudomonadota bacterium]
MGKYRSGGCEEAVHQTYNNVCSYKTAENDVSAFLSATETEMCKIDLSPYFFADEQKDMAILIQEGETGTGVRGDLLADDFGDELLFGGAGNDVILAGAEADVIYGLCVNVSEHLTLERLV